MNLAHHTNDSSGVAQSIVGGTELVLAPRPPIFLAKPAKPDIDTGDSVPEMVKQVLPALARREIYQRSGSLVHVVHEPVCDESGKWRPTGSLRIRDIPTQLLKNELNECADWFYTDPKGESHVTQVPGEVVSTVREAGEWPHVRPLKGFASWPVLRPDRRLATYDGYDAGTRFLLSGLPEVPALVGTSREDAQRSVAALLALLSDFPFQGEAEKAAWLAGLITLVARPAIQGPIPCLIIDAAIAGSGKTLLAKLQALIVMGQQPYIRATPRDDAEWNRAMLGIGSSGQPMVLFDNVRGKVESGAFEAVLTSATFADRKTRTAEEVVVDVPALFVLTANNATFSPDLARRALYIRLLPATDRPGLRINFKIDDIERHVTEQRPELLRHVFTILEAYRLAGAPPVEMRPMGSYGEWSRIVRAPLIWAGCADPALTQDTAYEAADDDMTEIHETMLAWHECFGDKSKTVREASLAASERLTRALRLLCDCPDERTIDTKQGKQIGSLFAKHKGAIHDGLRLKDGGTRGGSRLWAVGAMPQLQ